MISEVQQAEKTSAKDLHCLLYRMHKVFVHRVEYVWQGRGGVGGEHEKDEGTLT